MSAPSPSLLFVINSLAGGGAERVLCQVLAGFEDLARQHPIHLALLDDEPDRYRPPAFVTCHRLQSGGSLWRATARLSRLMRDLRPVAAASFLTRANLATILASRLGGHRHGVPVTISERVETSSHFGQTWRSLPARLLIRRLYPMADRVIAVSGGVASDLAQNFAVAPGRIAVIHNPVPAAEIRARGAESPAMALPPRFAVAVGRLVPNKAMDVLIRAFAASLDGAGGEDLVILGEGPERPALEALIAELGLTGRVHLPGFAANPHAVMARATCYVSASRAEGFPNALAEAMALGLPAIHSDCPAGPAEILTLPAVEAPAGQGPAGIATIPGQARETWVRDDRSPHAGSGHPGGAKGWRLAGAGILTPVDDVAALAGAMRALRQPALAEALAAAARRRALDFAPDRATAAYAAAIAGLNLPAPSLPGGPAPAATALPEARSGTAPNGVPNAAFGPV